MTLLAVRYYQLTGRRNMDYYYVDRDDDSDGFHQVHTRGCGRLPMKLRFIGNFKTAAEAVEAAKTIYEGSKCCPICTNDVAIGRDRLKQYD